MGSQENGTTTSHVAVLVKGGHFPAERDQGSSWPHQPWLVARQGPVVTSSSVRVPAGASWPPHRKGMRVKVSREPRGRVSTAATRARRWAQGRLGQDLGILQRVLGYPPCLLAWRRGSPLI